MGRRQESWIKESSFYKVIDNEKRIIRCEICERKCVLNEGAYGICRNHANIEGRLYNIAYGILSAIETRPIEIKPLFHYWPNSTALTFSGYGCNFFCPWCQNFHLSQEKPRPYFMRYVPPEELVNTAIKGRSHGLCASFNEPTIHAEYILSVAELAKENNLYFTLVTNGYMSIKALEKFLNAGVNGYSMDIKGCPETYKRHLRANPEVVFRNARYILENEGHVEMVFLIVTGANDSEECIKWVLERHLDTLGEDVPLHINRYYPAYKYHEPPTSYEKLLFAYNYARDIGIKYVYVGNIPEEEYQDTKCPKCGKVLIKRRRARVIYWALDDRKKCPRCGTKVPVYGEFVGYN
ncbi:MAG TPA: AmmeMemoRadiSam system radical SAM enzyme [Euryarchaeota archaeon]|nr:AmmeMemoRadiSam system radical SAM enzyme [Euryarchaeota archaeon]